MFMSKKVLILSGSPRKGGNSDLLCDEFMRGAAEKGNQVEKILIRDKKISYCKACYYCRDTGKGCAIKDDMAEILDKMLAADVIVLASILSKISAISSLIAQPLPVSRQ